MITPLALTIIGIILAILSFILITRSLESAIFWSILLGPAIGNSVINFILSLLGGETETAIKSMRFLPFFLSPIDETFFSIETASEELMVIGGVILFLWVYVISHYATRRFGIWGLPMIPSIMYVAGLTFPHLRARVAGYVSYFSFLFTLYWGVPFLVLITALLFVPCFLLWRRGWSVQIPLSPKLMIVPSERV